MRGLIFSVKRYSVHDGPGIRVTFFMKGCPLSCRWCHNPEGISPLPENIKRINKVGGESFSKEEQVGVYYSVDEVLEVIEKERVFISQSGGGVTFSGGEPMLQFDFLLAALKACRQKGIHTAVDTSGYSTIENFRAIMPFTDLFLFDLKHIDDKRHIEYTGVSNRLILENCEMLARESKAIMFRIPVIPGMNDNEHYIKKMRDFISRMNYGKTERINLLPYHKIGSSKYKRFNREWKMEGVDPPSGEEMKSLREFYMQTGIKVKIGG
jgi:pyruvate formate lyase activating enzyme